MKKIIALALGACLLGACCITGCGSGEKDPPKEETPPEAAGTELQTDRASIGYAFNDIFKNGEVADAAGGFATADDVTGARFFVDGGYKTGLSEITSRQDVKLELYNGTKTRIVNVSAGAAFTIPVAAVTADYNIAKYRIQYTFGDSILTYSPESSNPYIAKPDGWQIYVNEWLLRHVINDTYLEHQHLTKLRDFDFTVDPVNPATGTSDGSHTYPTVSSGNLTKRPGYEIYRLDIEIEDEDGKIERPFYNIGVVHAVNDSRYFGFFVMKSKEDRHEIMDELVMTWTHFSSRGIQRNYFDAGKPVEDPHWNEETRNFFRGFMAQETKSWGVFSYSMPGDAGSLVPGGGSYDTYLANSKKMQEFIENEVWGGKKFDICMTYTHLGSGAADNPKRIPHYFPTAMATELAGGNGDGTKPVLEFTYQFTTNNNLVDEEYSPLFDILRGKYDTYFERLAQDIKAYQKPVMFRLNNEMNTDWTSYSGIMNLLDPDIFTMTWRHLYDIFIANGVDNVIWVWNPIADSCPYSGWGEDLCYFPGTDYVQLLGGTSYEFNNYVGDAASQMTTFKKHYGDLYKKNKQYFDEYGMIIGEFACGSGGDATGALGRNADAQAKWVEGMFEELNAENPADYVKQIKGLIWFNCNDYAGGHITNRLKFTDANIKDRPETYTDLKKTWDAFKNGFANAK